MNPALVDAQLVGGVAFGIGNTLHETLEYDAGGQLLSGTLMDYALPYASDVPPVEGFYQEVPATTNPLGLRGLGECGNPGLGGAIANNGQLAVTTDHYPHIHEPAEGVLVCLGYNGRGVAMSTTMGPQLARRILGGTAAEIDMPITTLKQVPFHGLWKTAVAARITYGRIRDLLSV